MNLLYNTISTIGLFVYLPRLLSKKGPEDRSTFIKERLGVANYEKADIWVHAVSVGETLACIPFLKKLKKEFPGKSVVLSTTTYTGQKIARDKFPEANRIMYVPLDPLICVKRVVNRIRPEIFITVETELWPSLFTCLKEAGSQIVILNGRISPGSFKGYKKVKSFMKKLLSKVDFFYMQGKGDAERIILLGAEKTRVGFMGNFKFDIDFGEASPPEWMNLLSGKVMLAASTHEGEEEIVLEAFNEIKKNVPGTQLILAPRHPERFGVAAELLDKRSMSYIRRSLIREGASAGQGTPAVDVILLDTLGELSRVFSKASVAFIGGSLVPKGGHNVMEPAFWSKPIVFGPHMFNFPIADEFLKRSAAIEVNNAGTLAKSATELLNNNDRAADMGKNARSIVNENKGAVDKAIELLRSYIGTA